MPVSLIILKKKVKKYNHTLILKKEYTRFIHSKKKYSFPMFRERKVLCDLINEISENFEYLWNFTIENCSIEKETSIAIEYTVFNCS